MRHQKMMTWVSISGTALSIFLVMAFFMVDNAKTVEMAPESNRSRIFVGENMHIKDISGTSDGSAPVSYEYAQRLYGNLDGVEKISYINAWSDNFDVSAKGGEMFSAYGSDVDDEFWNIYDFTFIDGRPFDKAESDSHAPKVIVTRSLARRLYGEDKVAGREMVVDMMPYDIVGVVEDVNPLFKTSFANFYMIYDKGASVRNGMGAQFGNAKAIILAKEGVTREHLANQVKSRYATLNNEVKKDNQEAIYHEQPYTTQDTMMNYGSNTTPDTETHDRINYLIYTFLLLLPAINLSSMMRSRLRHRVSEIGVRRAFGAKKRDIVYQMFGENLLITFAGGIIGLVFSFLFVWLASNLFFDMSGSLDASALEIINAQPTLAMLFTWKNFFMALAACFILNVLSATVPAWKASRVKPAIAIAKSR